MRDRRSQMPAALLPGPAPTSAPDWSFQNPVGVDCSSPEPRCIWLAVLRGRAASPTFPSMHLAAGSGGGGHGQTNRVVLPPDWPMVR